MGAVESKYSEQMTSAGTKFLYWLVGFAFAGIGGCVIGMYWWGNLAAVLCGLAGMCLCWAVARARYPYIEYRADAVCMSIIGIASYFAGVFIAVNAGWYMPFFSQFNHDFFGWHVFIFVVAILFIIFNILWVYGCHLKQTYEEKELVLHGDDWIKPGEKHLRLDCGITLDCTADYI